MLGPLCDVCSSKSVVYRVSFVNQIKTIVKIFILISDIKT